VSRLSLSSGPAAKPEPCYCLAIELMTTIHIPDDTAARLRQAAQDEGRTLDELAGEGLAAYLASRAKLAALKTAIDEGDASGVAEDSSLEGILAEIRLRSGPPK